MFLISGFSQEPADEKTDSVKHNESSNTNNKADNRTPKQSIISKDQLLERRTLRSYFVVEIKNDQVSSIKNLDTHSTHSEQLDLMSKLQLKVMEVSLRKNIDIEPSDKQKRQDHLSAVFV